MGSVLGAACEEVPALPLPRSVSEVLWVLAVGTGQGLLPTVHGNKKDLSESSSPTSSHSFFTV